MWTIAELAAEAATALAADRPVVNGRIRDMPNERLIRWYTTIGLVDPPLARRGRIALYGSRHLLQLVAIKRRQAAGRSIAEIQAELTGAPDSTLAAIADLPAPAAPTAPAARPRFWAQPAAAAVLDGEATPDAAIEVERAQAGGVVQGVRLGPGVTLLLDGGEALDADEVAAITAAARPLLEELTRLGRHPGRPS